MSRACEYCNDIHDSRVACPTYAKMSTFKENTRLKTELTKAQERIEELEEEVLTLGQRLCGSKLESQKNYWKYRAEQYREALEVMATCDEDDVPKGWYKVHAQQTLKKEDA